MREIVWKKSSTRSSHLLCQCHERTVQREGDRQFKPQPFKKYWAAHERQAYVDKIIEKADKKP